MIKRIWVFGETMRFAEVSVNNEKFLVFSQIERMMFK